MSNIIIQYIQPRHKATGITTELLYKCRGRSVTAQSVMEQCIMIGVSKGYSQKLTRLTSKLIYLSKNKASLYGKLLTKHMNERNSLMPGKFKVTTSVEKLLKTVNKAIYTGKL